MKSFSLLRWLLIVIVVAAVWAAARYRHRIADSHDPGFAAATALPWPAGAAAPSRKIRSVPGEFMTLDPSGRFLINSFTNKPVFITGDSAWSMITELNDADLELYLSDRAARGFNYIWCAAADNYYQSHPPKDVFGNVPFDGADFTHEDEAYWKHVDYVLTRAQAHGITVALDPGFAGLNSRVGYLASYLDSSDQVLTDYGAFLGERYKKAPNLIWALGGDVDPGSGVVPKIDKVARGIRSRDTNHLMVAEGQPQHAALDTFAGSDWMDLNWLYFHTTNIPSGNSANYLRTPWLPPFHGEEWYENEENLKPIDLREQDYWAVLSGAYLGNGGFGNSPIWYFGAGPSAHLGDPSWKSQLGSSGSVGQMYLGKLFRSREHWKLIPDTNHQVMTGGYDSRTYFSAAWESFRALIHREPYRLGSASSVAARTADGQTIIAYVPNGKAATVTIAMNEIADPQSQAKCWWFNPRDGSSQLIGTLSTRGTQRFTSPDAEDWVLVVDSLSMNLPPPGSNDL